MLRFVLSNRATVDESGREVLATIYTVDADVPLLEQALASGGMNGARFDLTTLVGVEVLPVPTPRGDADAS